MVSTPALVSIIVPVYMAKDYLERCVSSIREQTYKNLEIILVNDGSPDDCPKMCEDFAAEDSRIRVLHKPNGGQASARNLGIQHSTGQWLMFIDSDDYIAPNMVQKLYETAQQHNSKVVYCAFTAFTEDENGYQEFDMWGVPPLGVTEGEAILKASVEQRQGLLGGYHIIPCNKIFHRSVFKDLRFPEGQVHEDEAIAHHILSCCGRIVGIEDSLYYYRQHNNSTMGTNKHIFRTLSLATAYGDRILFYNEKGYTGTLTALYDSYWPILVSYYYQFKKEPRCPQLLKRTLPQMRKVRRIWCKRNDIPFAKKMAISAFCMFPGMVSRLFAWSVRMRRK